MFATTRKSSRSLLTALVATPMLLLALAACSTGTGGASSAAPTAASGGGSSAADAELSAARDDYDLKLAECIRGKGFDVADPKPGEGFDSDDPEEITAAGECMQELGDPPGGASRKTDAEHLEDMIKTVDCLRGKGYEVNDPTIETGFLMPDDVSDADFETCQPS
ncbi:hypothetical protein [Microbacterium sp. MYb66]|jgi:hypothetical protein|uniref:hypothetical protein n=1 Tax=Microbacterium sp. MYb66 TaxID=1848692 RepID=UPI000D00EEEE|nr:hypothetical protein [Microbacterium sp. MYb66]PRA81337.1 hypothetical protein CQ045_08935 [Microbacterium sp. MYb66]